MQGENACGSEVGPKRDFDQFGGWAGRRFEATGFFRVEKGDRWWLVTPEGHAFLSWGINHLYPDLWKQDYNREAWKKKLSAPMRRRCLRRRKRSRNSPSVSGSPRWMRTKRPTPRSSPSHPDHR